MRRKCFGNAKQILVSELALSSSSDVDTIENEVNIKLDNSFRMYNPVSEGEGETDQV